MSEQIERGTARPPLVATALVGLPGAFGAFMALSFAATFARAWGGWNPDRLYRAEVQVGVGLALAAISLIAAVGIARRQGWASLLGGLMALGGVVLGGFLLVVAALVAGFGEPSDVVGIVGAGVGLIGYSLVALAVLIRGRHGLAPLSKPGRRVAMRAAVVVLLVLAVHVVIVVRAATMPGPPAAAASQATLQVDRAFSVPGAAPR